MTIMQRRTLPAIVAAAIGTGASLALAADPAVEQMQQQIEALKAEIAQLKSTQQQLNAADVDATIARVLEDANRRSQLLQVEGFTAGYTNGKFVLQSADGNFSLSPTFQLQIRHVVNAADQDDWETEHGFEIRRMRFGVAGNVFSKNLRYNIVWGSDRSGGTLSLEDAVVEYSFEGTPWAVYAGQFKDPVHHEELVSSRRQLAADRSLVNEALGGGFVDRVQGIGISYEEGPLFATVVYHDRAASANTNFVETDHFGFAGRVEYVVFGDKKNYSDFTAMGTTEDLLVIGAGVDWSEVGSFDVVSHTVDVQFENSAGLGLYAAYVAQWGEDDDDDFYDWGAVAQISYLLPDSKWEVFGRFGWIDFDNADDEIIEITAGVNYYMHGHSAKFTIDLTYLPEGSPEATGIGYLNSGDDDQWVLRSQFQLLI